jgi:hypothetical protein
MASIKTVVFSLLGGGDGGNGNDGGAKPTAPTLEPESSSEISLLNFLTSDCTTTTDEDDNNPSPIDAEPTQEMKSFKNRPALNYFNIPRIVLFSASRNRTVKSLVFTWAVTIRAASTAGVNGFIVRIGD